MSLLTDTWLMPFSSYSTGSSTVMIRLSVELMVFKNAYSEVDLPEPVGPVTSMMPCGLLMISLMDVSMRGTIPNVSSPFKILPRNSRRNETLSP